MDEEVKNLAFGIMRELRGREENGHAATADDVAEMVKYIDADKKIRNWTAVVVALNWLIWETYKSDEPKAREYDALWRKYDAATFEPKRWTSDEVAYYLRNTD